VYHTPKSKVITLVYYKAGRQFIKSTRTIVNFGIACDWIGEVTGRDFLTSIIGMAKQCKTKAKNVNHC